VLTCRARRNEALDELDGVLAGTVFQRRRGVPWCLRHGNPPGRVMDGLRGDGRPVSVMSFGLSARRCSAAASLLLAAPPKAVRTPVAAALRGGALLQPVAAHVGGDSASPSGGTPSPSGRGASRGDTLGDSKAMAAGVGMVETLDDSEAMEAAGAREPEREGVRQPVVGKCGICVTSGPITETEELMAGMMDGVVKGRGETELCDPCATAVRGLFANQDHVETPAAVAAWPAPAQLTCRVCTTAAALNRAGLCVGSCESDAEQIRRGEIKERCRLYRSDDPQQRWSDVDEGMAVVDELNGILSELGDIGAEFGEDTTGPQRIQALVEAVGKMRKPPPEVMDMLERYGESAAVHDEEVGVEAAGEAHLHVCETLVYTCTCVLV
jgi:hypothetical protein